MNSLVKDSWTVAKKQNKTSDRYNRSKCDYIGLFYVTYSEGYSLTLTDYNNVLDKFDFKSANGVTVTKSGSLKLVKTKCR